MTCTEPGRAAEVAATLAGIPQVVSVYLTAGDFDLHALLWAPDDRAISRLAHLPGHEPRGPRAGGWPAQLALWLTVGDHLLDAAGGELSGWPETRFCFAALGPGRVLDVDGRALSLVPVDLWALVPD